MTLYRLSILFVLTYLPSLFAQDSSAVFKAIDLPVRINQIVIIGNKQTQDEVIRREVLAANGDVIDEVKQQNIRGRVESLDLFKNVRVYVESVRNDTILFIDVEERLYFFPVPYFQLVDQNWNQLNFGGGVVHNNLYGRNQKVYAVGWLGFNPGFSLSYYNPWVGRNRYLLGTSVYLFNIKNRIYDFRERHFGGRFTFGKNYSVHTRLSVSTTFEHIELPAEESFYGDSLRHHDNLLKLEGNFSIDTRNSRFFPTRGYFVAFQYFYAKWQNQVFGYQNMGIDLRYFYPLGLSSTLGVRSFSLRRSSKQPVTDLLLLGFDNRIRGYFQRVQQGTWLNISSASLRFPLLPIRLYDFPDFFGIYEEQLRNLPFGISMAVFADTGFLVPDLNKLRSNDLLSGYGAGLLVHLPYANVLRLDVAVNDNLDNVDFILQIGTAF
jgi:outer membrane protein assembly factor BamA